MENSIEANTDLEIHINNQENQNSGYLHVSENRRHSVSYRKYLLLNAFALIFAFFSIISLCIAINYCGFLINYLINMVAKTAVIVQVIICCKTLYALRRYFKR